MNVRMKKFFSYYRPYLGVFFADMLCAVLVSIVTLALPLCIRSITKSLETPTEATLHHIYLIGAVMLGLVAVYLLCHAFIDYQGHLMGAQMERDMRSELFDHYQKLSFKFYDEHRTGELMTRIASDSFDLSELYHHGPEDIVISLLNFIGSLIILLSINMKLGLIAFSFIPVMFIYGFYFSKRMHHALRKSRDRIGDINAQVEDSLAGIRVVQSFTNEKKEKEKFTETNDQFFESRKEGYKSETYFYQGLTTLTQLMTIAVVIFGAVSIVHGTLDLADLLTFLLYIVILIEPIQRLGNFTRLYQEGITGFNRFMEVLEIEPEIQDTPNATPLTTPKGNIEFKNVSFQYREGYDHVLKNLSLSIKPGEYLALVGPSGAGKTTLCSLIPRFYEATQGEIRIDGQGIGSLTLQSLRQNIGLVQQEVYLFAGSVLENIAYGRLDASYDEIVSAAKKANAHEFIMALPQGYKTDIGQRGVKLSGGQKQRLSIARVFLKNPPILIFDEATSSLDNESEKAVQEAMEKLTTGRTTLVIAHRLSTIRGAARILVLTDQGIEEEGTHQELLARNQIYASLYKMHLTMQDSPSA